MSESNDNTTKSLIDTPDLIHVFNQVHGFLSLSEAELLYRLASEVPPGGNIVEIGSYQGRSTICLGLGAKVNGARVYAIDSHEDYQVNETTFYSMKDQAALFKNLLDFDVADIVRVVTLPSGYASIPDIYDLLWIDGAHDYAHVAYDLAAESIRMKQNGKIALHDSSGHFPDVTRALDEILTVGQWIISEQVDATTVLVRA